MLSRLLTLLFGSLCLKFLFDPSFSNLQMKIFMACWDGALLWRAILNTIVFSLLFFKKILIRNSVVITKKRITRSFECCPEICIMQCVLYVN